MPFGDNQNNQNSFNSVESKLGVLEGLLTPLPGQIQELFARVNSHIEDQAGKHASLDTHSDDLDKKLKKTCVGEEGCPLQTKVTELGLIIQKLQSFVDSSKESSTFMKKHIATIIVSVISMVVGSVFTYVLINFLTGKGAI